MLRPEPMTRVLVVGPKDELERVIEALYDLQLVHLVDHRGEDDEISIGKPLPKAREVSENLVKLRSIANILNVGEAENPEEAGAVADLRGAIATLEVNLREEEEARTKMERLLQDITRQIEELAPFATLGTPLETYHGYDFLEVIVGRVADDVRGLEVVTPEFEMVQREGLVAVFVAKSNADRVREHLAKFAFAPIEIPKGEGDPAELLARAQSDKEKWAARLSEVHERLAKLREKYAKFIVQAEELLRVEIEKAEAPLRFAASEHSFVAEGWVPAPEANRIRSALASLPGVVLETTDVAAAHGKGEPPEEDKPPVLLRNRGPPGRFEFLTHLYSTPQYDEVDPTSFLFLFFPLFFGLMIGDAGYGLVMIVLGFALSAKFRDNPSFSDLMRVMLYGGIFAFVFGLLLYGEIFGIPLHAPVANPHEVSWSAILGYAVPYTAPIHKLELFGVVDLLLLSIVAAFLHLTIGYVVGFVNEIHHNKKHAVSRIGWLLVLVGLFAFFVILGRSKDPLNPLPRVVNLLFFDRAPLAWIPATGFVLGGLTVPYFSIALIVAGLGVLLPTEGGLALVEVIGLLANMMSYTRLAGIAVAKGAVVLAFNTMLLPLIIHEELFVSTGVLQLNPSIPTAVAGFALLILAHLVILVLGSVSAGIQALRLNYVEFFLKFYQGGGALFSPFGARKQQTEA